MSRVTKVRKVLQQKVMDSIQVVNGSFTEDRFLGMVEIKTLRLTLPVLAPEFHGYRLVQISDIHMDRIMSREHVRRAVDIVNQLQPDLVAVTGDFVTVDAERYAEDLIEALSQLQPRDAAVAVMGNHDLPPWSKAEIIPWVIEASGMLHLKNTVHTLHRDEAMLHVAGVDDMTSGDPQLGQVLEALPPGGAAILLSHAPDFADESAATGRFALQISGHSHGGQVSLPVVGARVFPRNGRKYPAGCYLINGMYQYTNRGLGMSYPRVRMNCPPEITLIQLQTMPV
jgi:hypothetical protein